MTKVRQWPTSIVLDGNPVCNPSPEQCRLAGYELVTQAEIDAEAAAQAQAAAERAAYVQALRDTYKANARRFCQLAGIAVVDKFADASVVQAEIEKANYGEDTAKALQLTQIALALQNLITELRRKDGDDAWERI